MRFTSMFRYGLRAMAVLADNYGKGLVSAKEISTCEDISPSFLEQLLAQLRRSGLITGVRGPGGGFKLRKHPSKIHIGEIVRALEGPVVVSKCLISAEDQGAEICNRFEDCPVVPLFRQLESDFERVLDSYKLSDLMGNTRAVGRTNRSSKVNGGSSV
jgi:Rrf2 family protein